MSNRTTRLLESFWNHPLAEPLEEYEHSFQGWSFILYGMCVHKAIVFIFQGTRLL